VLVLTGEDVDGDKGALGVAVLAGLGGGHIRNLQEDTRVHQAESLVLMCDCIQLQGPKERHSLRLKAGRSCAARRTAATHLAGAALDHNVCVLAHGTGLLGVGVRSCAARGGKAERL
jgi:hypothetical protein